MNDPFELTNEQRRIIREAWRSYDCTMGDPWRNDFEEDGQTADEWRRDYMIQSILEQDASIPDDEIEREIDRIR